MRRRNPSPLGHPLRRPQAPLSRPSGTLSRKGRGKSKFDGPTRFPLPLRERVARSAGRGLRVTRSAVEASAVIGVQGTEDARQDLLRVAQNLVIPEPQHAEAAMDQPFGSCRVLC